MKSKLDLTNINGQLYDAETEEEALSVLRELGIEITQLEVPGTIWHINRKIKLSPFHGSIRIYIEAYFYETINLSSMILDKLRAIQEFLIDAYRERVPPSLDEVAANVIYAYPLDTAYRAPIYTKVYTFAHKNEPDSFEVFAIEPEEGGRITARLHEITLREAMHEEYPLYVAIEHELRNSLSAVDWTEVITEEDMTEYRKYGFGDTEPRKFQEAALCASPKLKLF